MRAALVMLAIFAATAASAQMQTRFRMAGTFSSSPSLISAGTYTVQITFRNDQTANSYFATAIQPGWRVVTGTRKMYTITAVTSTTFSTAALTIQALGSTSGAPSGLIMVYEYDGTLETIPDLPVNSTGTTAQLSAAIITHNAEITGSGGGGSVITSEAIRGNGLPGDPLDFYGFYTNHSDAAANGVPIGGTYKAAISNTMGMAYGSLTTRPF